MFADQPNWLDEFEELANNTLDHGSACDQVHPVVEAWHDDWITRFDPDELRPSVTQALSCLTTEVISYSPEHIMGLLLEHLDEDEVMSWVQHLLVTGKAFQEALSNGQLDDL